MSVCLWDFQLNIWLMAQTKQTKQKQLIEVANLGPPIPVQLFISKMKPGKWDGLPKLTQLGIKLWSEQRSSYVQPKYILVHYSLIQLFSDKIESQRLRHLKLIDSHVRIQIIPFLPLSHAVSTRTLLFIRYSICQTIHHALYFPRLWRYSHRQDRHSLPSFT